MFYGHGIRVPALHDRLATCQPLPAAQSWRRLDGDHRLALIEQTLNPANDRHPAL